MADRGAGYRRQSGRIAHRVADAVFASPVYRLLLGRGGPRSLNFVPTDPWPGQDERGLAIISGHWRFAGLVISQDAPPWDAEEAGEDYLVELHGFTWLRDLKAVGGDAGRRATRAFVDDWIAHNDRWHALTWRPDVLASRISCWLGGHDFFCLSAETGFRQAVLQSLQRQASHLSRVVERSPEGLGRLEAIKALILSALALRLPQGALQRGVRLLDRALDLQVLADGAQSERNPSVQLAALRHLIDIRAALRQARVVAPTRLQTSIERMAPALRFYRHGDGGLALFNGSFEEGAYAVEHALTQADALGRPLKSARESGFQRVMAGRTLVVMDTGRPPPAGLDRNAHAGPLAIEMSLGRDRVIVNCGHWAARDSEEDAAWFAALSATAAHSTLTVASTNAFTLGPRGGVERGPTRVAVDRKDTLRGVLIDALHDGYRERYGLTHRRRMFIEGDGGALRGEDVLMADSEKSRGVLFAVRFHLHPDVDVEPTGTGDSAVLRVGGRREAWHFQAVSAELAVEDSIYVGRPGDRRRTRQIVLHGKVGADGAFVGWILQRGHAPAPTDAPARAPVPDDDFELG